MNRLFFILTLLTLPITSMAGTASFVDLPTPEAGEKRMQEEIKFRVQRLCDIHFQSSPQSKCVADMLPYILADWRAFAAETNRYIARGGNYIIWDVRYEEYDAAERNADSACMRQYGTADLSLTCRLDFSNTLAAVHSAYYTYAEKEIERRETLAALPPPPPPPPPSLASMRQPIPDSISKHVHWCFQPGTNNRLIDQPMDRGTCGALLAVGGAAAYFSGNTELGALLLNSRQNQWAAESAKQACLHNQVSDQAAIRLIQACQCHNPSAQQIIENNQTEVLQVLRERGGC